MYSGLQLDSFVDVGTIATLVSDRNVNSGLWRVTWLVIVVAALKPKQFGFVESHVKYVKT